MQPSNRHVLVAALVATKPCLTSFGGCLHGREQIRFVFSRVDSIMDTGQLKYTEASRKTWLGTLLDWQRPAVMGHETGVVPW